MVHVRESLSSLSADGASSDVADGDDDAPDNVKEVKMLEQRIRLLASALRSVWMHYGICIRMCMYICIHT